MQNALITPKQATYDAESRDLLISYRRAGVTVHGMNATPDTFDALSAASYVIHEWVEDSGIRVFIVEQGDDRIYPFIEDEWDDRTDEDWEVQLAPARVATPAELQARIERRNDRCADRSWR